MLVTVDIVALLDGGFAATASTGNERMNARYVPLNSMLDTTVNTLCVNSVVTGSAPIRLVGPDPRLSKTKDRCDNNCIFYCYFET